MVTCSDIKVTHRVLAVDAPTLRNVVDVFWMCVFGTVVPRLHQASSLLASEPSQNFLISPGFGWPWVFLFCFFVFFFGGGSSKYLYILSLITYFPYVFYWLLLFIFLYYNQLCFKLDWKPLLVRWTNPEQILFLHVPLALLYTKRVGMRFIAQSIDCCTDIAPGTPVQPGLHQCGRHSTCLCDVGV